MTSSSFQQYPLKRKWIVLFLSLLALYLPDSFQSLTQTQPPSTKGILKHAVFQKQEKLLLITRCHDGDTCTGIDERNFRHTLRLVGIDAPEVAWAKKPGQEYGQESKKFLETLVKGKRFTVLLIAVDRYHRYLALIIDEKQKNETHSINEQMILEGFAFAYRGYAIDPEVRRWAVKAETSARKQQKGLWALKIKPINPYEFRKLKNKN